jgi:hypothetical protein
MTPQIPIGQEENLKLEFKRREALQKPASIAREIVAMLNTEGGQVWIGISEEDGRAVAAEGIPTARRALDSLLDHIVETIEPVPTEQEVSFQVVPDDHGLDLLVARVRPDPAHRPYAQLSNNARRFVRRVGARTVSMSRDEIFSMARAGGQPSDATANNKALQIIKDERQQLWSEKAQILWIAIQPCKDLHVDVQAKDVEELLVDPLKTRNRLSGWTFHSYDRPKLTQHAISAGTQHRRIKIMESGGIRFHTALDSLHLRGEANQIWPYALVEFPVSVVRLASAVYFREAREKIERKAVVMDFELIGATGWELKPFSPDDLMFSAREGMCLADDDWFFPDPPSFTFAQIIDEPDACAFKLVRKAYQAFGHTEEKIPHEFDPATHQLRLPQ